MKRLALLAAAFPALLGLAAPGEAAAQEKALVYCPAADAAGCARVVAALGGAGWQPRRAYDGTTVGGEATLDLRAPGLDLTEYRLLVVPGHSDHNQGSQQVRPYDVLRNASAKANLVRVLTGRALLYSGTPDQGTQDEAKKVGLIQRAAAWAGTGSSTGLVVLYDASTANTPYGWLPDVSGVAVARENGGGFNSVKGLSAVGAAVLTPNAASYYGSMAADRFVAPTGGSVDARSVHNNANHDNKPVLVSFRQQLTTLALAPSSATVSLGGSFAFTATLTRDGSPAQALANQTVVFRVAGIDYPRTTDASGVATLSSADLSPAPGGGTHAVQAAFAGHVGTGAGSNLAGSRAAASLTVNAQQGQTISFDPPASPAAYNSSFAVSASATSGLPVGFSVSAGSACTLAGSTVTMTSGTGACEITASQAGDAAYTAAEPVTRTVAAAKLPQAISLTGAPASSGFGTSFAVSATGGDSGNPVVLAASGACSLDGTTVTMNGGTGSCALTADQAGNANYEAAPQATKTVAAEKAAQTISFAAPASPAAFSSAFGVSPTATSGLTVDVAVSGVCSISGGTVTMTSGTGDCTVTATQAGNADYDAAAPVAHVVAASKLGQTIAFAAPASPAAYNSSFPVSPSASSGLPVALSVSGVCSLSGSTVTMTSGVGSCVVTASQAGDADYETAAPVPHTVAAKKLAQTIEFGALGGKTYGDAPFTVSASASSGLGVVFSSVTPGKCTVAGSTVTVAEAGGCTIRASQAGNDFYEEAPGVERSFEIARAPQTIDFAQPASPAVYGTSFPVSGSASSGLAVSFSVSGVCSLDGSSVTMTGGTGSCEITASQAGSVNYLPAANVARTVAAARANQTITFAAPASPAEYNTTFPVSPSASSGLAVSVGVSGVCSLSGGTITMTSGTGSCVVTAAQPGNDDYNPAAPVAHTVAAKKAAQAIDFTQPASPAVFGTSFSVAPTASSSLGVTVVATGVCSISGGTVTMTSGTGACTLTARQGGDDDYEAAADVPRTVAAAKAGQPDAVVVTGIPSAAQVFGTSFTVGASGGNGTGAYSFAAAGACTVNAATGVAQMTSGTGTCSITATRAADADYLGRTSDAATVGAAKAGAPIVLGSLVQAYSGTPRTATATTTPAGLPVVVTYSQGGSPVAGPVQIGVYAVTAAIDSPDYEGTASGFLAIYDPTAGFVTGGGWIWSPAAACRFGPCTAETVGQAHFGFNSRYQKGANKPAGNTEFQFQAGNLSFKSLDYEWLVVNGTSRAQFKGRGTINGQGSYGFLLTALDGDNFGNKRPDSFRIKIWDVATGATVYDNQMGQDETGDAATLLGDGGRGGGSIVIHSK
ncbi:MAG TPA: MBG domain-containing protein [Longimicrobiaceae bacterium]|nr:MBG domain-containing protein [Longimicrobiaceae bacterium]